MRKKKRNNCKFCGKQLNKPEKVYCNNLHQGAYFRQQKIDRWLKTGKAITNSSSRHYIYLYLLKQQNNRCIICNQSEKWNDKHLRFILDHIDGIHTNNKRNNLRLVCPNCDSQLDTYKGKNKGNGRSYRRNK